MCLHYCVLLAVRVAGHDQVWWLLMFSVGLLHYAQDDFILRVQGHVASPGLLPQPGEPRSEMVVCVGQVNGMDNYLVFPRDLLCTLPNKYSVYIIYIDYHSGRHQKITIVAL